MYWGLWTGFLYWIMYWIFFVLAGSLLLFFPFHFIWSHVISSHSLSFQPLCPVMSLYDMKSINTWMWISGKRYVKNHLKNLKRSMSAWSSWLAVFHHWGHQFCWSLVMQTSSKKSMNIINLLVIQEGCYCMKIIKFLEIIHGKQQQKIKIQEGCYCMKIIKFLEIIHGKQQQKNQLKWSIFWWFRRVVNKISMSNW